MHEMDGIPWARQHDSGRARGLALIDVDPVQADGGKRLIQIRQRAADAAAGVQDRMPGSDRSGSEQTVAKPVRSARKILNGAICRLGILPKAPVQMAAERMQEIARLCRADQAVIYRPQSGTYRFAAGHSTVPEYLEIEKQTTIVPGHGTVVGRAALTRQVARVDDSLTDPLYEHKDDARVGGVRSMIGVPLMREGEPIGVIALARNRVEPFTDREIELVTTFADQAVIAIENVRLFEAEQQRTRELTESLQQQSATADVLKVISRSAFDLQTVLDTLVESAARLCDADSAAIHRPDGNSYPYVASYGYSREYHEYMRERPIIPGRGTVAWTCSDRMQTDSGK